MTLTLKTAREQHLDVFFFTHPVTKHEDRDVFAKEFVAVTGRETKPFEETVARFTLLCLAVNPRPGVIAPVLKARKQCPKQ